MSNQKYDAIWVKGSFFERGHWKFVPRTDSGGGALGAILAVGVVIFIVFCLILTLPLWISLLGFSMVKSKRYYAGIVSILALLYFFIDVYKNWISGYLLFGYNSSDGAFNEGLFGEKFAIYFYIINGVGTLLALIFITDSELFNKTEYSINKNHTQANIKRLITLGLLLIIIGLGFYSISTKIHNRININNNSTVELDTLSNNVEETNIGNQGGEDELVSYHNDTLSKYNLSDDTYSTENISEEEHSTEVQTKNNENNSNNSTYNASDISYNIKSENELEIADKNLNSIYKQVMAVLKETEKTALRLEQRKWIKNRDVSCEEETGDLKGGNLYMGFLNNCKKEKTEKRIEELNDILQSKE